LATLFKRQDELDSAAVYFRRALHYAPNGPESQAGLCAVLLQGLRAAEALPACRRASELRPERARYRAQWGQALRLVGQLQEAEAVLLQALELDSAQVLAAYELAFLYQGQGKVHAAEALYRRALARRADHFAAHFNLAVLLEDSGRVDEAADHYAQVQQADSALWQRVRGDAE
jgi:tetratricopeptide (TPR) repeat protein